MDRFLGLIVLVVALFVGGCASRQAAGGRGVDPDELAAKVNYSGGNGDNPEEAVVITGVAKQSEGLVAEYNYISGIHGEKNKRWSINGQTILKEKDKFFDVIEIKLIDFGGEQRIYYFDVTSFPWKKH
jgi:hypothetical protein